jgi:serine/threonine-protein kinase Stk1
MNDDAADEQGHLHSHSSKRFLLQRPLASGGMCETYLALDLVRVAWGDATPHVVIKKLLAPLAHNPQAKLSLAHEFYILRHLIHQGVPRVFDLHVHDADLYLSMEYLEGKSIPEILAHNSHGLGKEALPLLLQLWQTLAYLHGIGVAHGDVKPGNLFLTGENRLVLLDYNMALAESRPGCATAPVCRGLPDGFALPSYSLLYASPKRIESKTPSRPDDIYACCCTTYEIFSGMHPFSRRSAVEARETGVLPEKPENMPLPLWRPLAAGLSFEAEQRPSAQAICRVFSARSFFSAWAACLRNHFQA